MKKKKKKAQSDLLALLKCLPRKSARRANPCLFGREEEEHVERKKSRESDSETEKTVRRTSS